MTALCLWITGIAFGVSVVAHAASRIVRGSLWLQTLDIWGFTLSFAALAVTVVSALIEGRP